MKYSQTVLLLFSDDQDSSEALKYLLKIDYRVHCLRIEGVLNTEKLKARLAANKMASPVNAVAHSFFDKENSNIFKSTISNLVKAIIVIRSAKNLGADQIVFGIKENAAKNIFLKILSFPIRLMGLSLNWYEVSLKDIKKVVKKDNSEIYSWKKKLFYFFISNLPTSIRHSFYRNKFARVPANVPEGLTFELARTKTDLEEAFKLLHNAYVEQGFIEPQESGMRLIIQHALPTTSILVAKMNGKVVGTISVMRDTPLGLPMEKVFDISHLKKKGLRVAEMSCLAIHPDYRRKMGGHIFFPLTLFAAMYAENSFGTDSLVFNLYPHHADFYNAIFGSTHLNNDKNNTIFYLGAPAAAIQLDLAASRKFGLEKYAGLPPEKDLYEYTYVTKHSYFKYPQKEMGVINYPVMTPEIFRYFFEEKINLLKNLTELEEQVLARYYPMSSYAKVIPITKHKVENIRGNARWDVRLEAHCEEEKILMLDVSKTGFRAHLEKIVSLNESHQFNVVLKENKVATVLARAVWKSNDGVYGFLILKANESWYELIETQADTLKRIA